MTTKCQITNSAIYQLLGFFPHGEGSFLWHWFSSTWTGSSKEQSSRWGRIQEHTVASDGSLEVLPPHLLLLWMSGGFIAVTVESQVRVQFRNWEELRHLCSASAVRTLMTADGIAAPRGGSWSAVWNLLLSWNLCFKANLCLLQMPTVVFKGLSTIL